MEPDRFSVQVVTSSHDVAVFEVQVIDIHGSFSQTRGSDRLNGGTL